MTNENLMVTAIFKNKETATRALSRLEAMGYDKEDLSFLISEKAWHDQKELTPENRDKASEETAIGAGVGGVVGAVAAGLTSVGVIAATGGVGILATGPIIATLTSISAGGVLGGLIGGLIGLGYPEAEAKWLEEAIVGKGSVIVGIETPPQRLDDLKLSLKIVEAEKIRVH